MSRIFYSEHDANDFNNTSIEFQEAVVHPEMLDQSRKSKIQGWREYGVYQDVKRADVVGKGKQMIRTRWIDTWKNTPDQTRTIVLALNIMANEHWTPKTVDVEKASFQSEVFDIFIVPSIAADVPGKIV